MEMPKVFRALVWASLALFALSVGIVVFEPAFPDGVNAYLEGEGAGSLFSNLDSGPLSLQILQWALFLGLLIAYLASRIGLLMFRRWARATFLGVLAALLACIPWMGATLTTPLAMAVGTLLSMIDGAIVVVLLFDPIKSKFAKPSAPVSSTY